MTEFCPGCGGASVKQGTKARRVLDVGPRGIPEIGSTRVQRWRCQECATYFTTGFNPSQSHGMSTPSARDAVAKACSQLGYAAAAARFGIDEKTARSLWREWAAPRERGLPERPPEFLGLHVMAVAGFERTLVTDVTAMTLVDVLRGAAAADVTAWLDDVGGRGSVDTVAVAMHQPFREVLRQRIPRARLAICPGHAASLGMRAFLGALRARRRLLGYGAIRNVAEAPRTFATRANALSQAQTEDMEGWDDSTLLLYSAKETFLDGLATGSAAEASRAMTESRRLCLSIPGAAHPALFIDAWQTEMAAGVGEPSLAPFATALAEAQERWMSRRPALPFDLARGLAVLADGRQVTQSTEETDDDELSGQVWNRGIALESVARAFAAA